MLWRSRMLRLASVIIAALALTPPPPALDQTTARPLFPIRAPERPLRSSTLAAGLGPALMADGLPGVGNHQAGAVHKLRLAMMVNGIDLSDPREAQKADTLAALRKSVRMGKQEG